MNKILKHLTNVPVAIALAFLLVGAPAVPGVHGLPSSGVAHAAPPPAPPPGLCDHGSTHPLCIATGGGAVGVLLLIAGFAGIIMLINEAYTLTNPEKETILDQMHAWIWSDAPGGDDDDDDDAGPCDGLEAYDRFFCNLGYDPDPSF